MHNLWSLPEDISEIIIGFLPVQFLHFLLDELSNCPDFRSHPLLDPLVRGICRNRFILSELDESIGEVLKLANLHPATKCPISVDFKFDSYNEDETENFLLLLKDPYLHPLRDVHVLVEKDNFFQDGIYRFCLSTDILAPCMSELSLNFSSSTYKNFIDHIFLAMPTFSKLKKLLLTCSDSCQEYIRINIPDSVEHLHIDSNLVFPVCWPRSMNSLTYFQNVKCLDLSRCWNLESLELYQDNPDFSCVLPATLQHLSLSNTTSESLESMDLSTLPYLQSLRLALLPHLHTIAKVKFPVTLKSLEVDDCPIGHLESNLKAFGLILNLSLIATHLNTEILELVCFTELEKLTLADSRLKALPDLSHLSNLQELIILDSSMTTLLGSCLPGNLEKLSVTSRNTFTVLNLPSLHSLTLQNVYLDHIQFPSSLEELTLSHTSISKEKFSSQRTSFQNFQFPQSLRLLSITRSPWIVNGLNLPSSLTDLSLRGNSLHSLKEIHIPHIKKLDVSENDLAAINCNHLPPTLRDLRISKEMIPENSSDPKTSLGTFGLLCEYTDAFPESLNMMDAGGKDLHVFYSDISHREVFVCR